MMPRILAVSASAPARRPHSRLNRAALAASASFLSLFTLAAMPAVAQTAGTLPGTQVLQGGRWTGAKLPSVAQTNNGLVMTIEQQQKRALLDWSRFDVAKGEEVHFKQGGADWIALNRIFDSKPSEIAGRITAKGQVWLSNSNGIIFKDGAQVNAHSILATTLNITEDQLYNGILTGSGVIRGAVKPQRVFSDYTFDNLPLAPKPIEGLDPSAILIEMPVEVGGQKNTPLQLMAAAAIRMAVIRDAEGEKADNPNYRYDLNRFDYYDQNKGVMVNTVDRGFTMNGLGDALDTVTAGINVAELGGYNFSEWSDSSVFFNGIEWQGKAATYRTIPQAMLDKVAAQIKTQFVDSYASLVSTRQQAFNHYVANSRITIEKGASLTAATTDAASPGKIMLFAPNISNAGKLQAHDGQVLLAAGEAIKLSNGQAFTNSARGGLAVNVMASPITDSTGSYPGLWYPRGRPEWMAFLQDRTASLGMTASNSGEILVDRGAVTMVGANVDQLGKILVTNGVRQRNGTIVLQASHGFEMSEYSVGGNYFGGKLTLGENSVTSITPDTSDLTGLAADTFTKGKILLAGQDIVMERNAQAVSRSGEIIVHASPYGTGERGGSSPGATDGSGRENRGEEGSFTMREGARIDVSGLRGVERSVAENVFAVEVRSNELSASPKQRDGILQGETVYVDRRTGATIVDWTGALAGEQRTAEQMSTAGGTVQIRASNYTVIDNGATIDVSGGSTQYLGGEIKGTRLKDVTGRFHNIADADPNRAYVGIHQATRTVEGYVEGANAGSVEILSPSSVLFGKLKGDVVVGEQQILAALGQVAAPKMPKGAVAAASVTVTGMPKGGSAVLHRGGPDYATWSSNHAFILADDKPFTATLWSEGEDDSWTPSEVDLNPRLIGQDWSEYEGEQPRFVQFLKADFFSGMADVSMTYGSSHQTLAINPNVAIRLQPGGGFNWQAESGITSIGDNVSIVAPSGEVAVGGTIGKNVSISVAAPWVNDVDAAAGTLRGYVDGGSISILGTLTAPVILDASGGGWLQRLSPPTVSSPGEFKLHAGKGGDVQLVGSQKISEMLGFADISVVGLGGGGTLGLIAAGELVVGPKGGNAGDAEYLDDTLLQDMGIGKLNLAADKITFVDGANVEFRSRTLLLNGRPIDIKTGSNLRDVGTLALLPDHQRTGASLSFTAGELLVAKGAKVEVDPTGTLTLNADKLTIDGTVRARGGNIQFSGPSGNAQSIIVSAGALIDASGIAQTVKVPGGANRRGFWYEGRVLDGGKISISGSDVVLHAGSVLDVSGTTGQLGVWKPGRYTAVKVNDTIGSDAGSIEIHAPGGYLLATMKGEGGTQFNYAGQLSISGGREGKLLLPGNTNWGTGEQGLRTILSNLEWAFYPQPTPEEPVSLREVLASDPWAQQTLGFGPDDIEDILITDIYDFMDFMKAVMAPYVKQSPADVAGGLKLDAKLTTAPNGPGAPPLDFAIPDGFEVQDMVKFRRTMEFVLRQKAYFSGDLNELSRGGTAYVGAPVLEGMKRFDTVNLSGNLKADQATEVASKRVLSIGGAISAGVDMKFSSRIIHLTGTALPQPIDPASAGTLTISGEMVQFGNARFGVGGFEKVVIEAQGDIRGVGLQAPDPAAEFTPGLITSGDLVLRAAQIYPTTDSILTFESSRSVRVEQTGRREAPLSAGGKLLITAPLIQQGGTLRAPFGEIHLTATGTTDDEGVYKPGRVELLDGSTTSTAADGRVILYGSTYDGQSWFAPLRDQSSTEMTTPPEKRVTLTADTIDVQKGATIDVSGSGDVLGLEFVPGPLGQTNVLNEPGMYAIVPAYGDKVVAPIDPLHGTTGIGDAVWLTAFDGNPAGWYTLLPAEYALTPGGYLISMANELQPGALEPRQMGDDSFAVLGHRGISGTAIADQLQSTFRVERGTDVRHRSEFFETYGNSFFSSERFLEGLKRSGGVYNADPRLPVDGGFLTLAANRELKMDGTVLAGGMQGLEGARGGVVDITSDNIVIAAPGTDVSDLEGYLVLDPRKISNIAESLLIGGVRRQGVSGLEVVVGQTTRSSQDEVRDPAKSVGAENVVIRTNSANALTGTELLFAANESVRVESGSVVRATGNGADAADLAIAPSMPEAFDRWGNRLATAEDRGGAFLRVSNLGDISVSRSDVKAVSGDLTIEAGALLEATDSIILDSTRNTVAESGAILRSGAITAAAGLVSFGDVPAGTEGFVASGQTLAALAGANALTLKSYSTLDFYGNVDLNLAGTVVLDGSALVGRGVAPAQVRIASGSTLELRNSDAAAFDATGNGGTLSLVGRNVRIGEGDMDIAFADTRIDAAERLIFDGIGDNSFDGALTVRAVEVTGSSGAGHEVKATGKLNLLAQQAGGQLPAFTTAGALLAFEGSEVEIATAITAGSGTVRATAQSGDVRLTSAARIDVSGSDVSFFEVQGFLPGGGVQLTSVNGDVLLDQGSVVDISGGNAGGDAGSLVLSAGRGIATLGGKIEARVNGAYRGGSFGLTTSTLGDFGGLNALLNQWDISRARDFAILDGDVVLNGVTRVDALRIVTGNGDISVAADAVIGSDSAKGGSILLASGGDLTIASGARLDVNAKGTNQRGGSVDLQVASGGTIHVAGAIIDVSGTGTGTGGEVRLRAPQVGNDVGVAGWGANVVGGDTRLEAFRVYELGDADGNAGNGHLAEIDTALQQQVLADAAAFMAAGKDGIVSRLGQSANSRFHVVPGIELRSEGDLDLVNHWNLKDARYDGQAGVLTLRAGGSLLLNANLSDGFHSAVQTPDGVVPPDGWASTDPLPQMPEKDLTNDQSWSYNLVAGADFAQTNVLSVRAGGEGSIEVGGLVRTGTGDIRLAAGGDLNYEAPNIVRYQFSGDSSSPLNGTTLTVPGGTVIADGTTLQPTTWPVDRYDADGNQVTVTYYPRLPAGTTLRKGTSVPAGTVMPDGTTLAADTVLAADVTLLAETIFPGTLVINGKTRTGGELVISIPRVTRQSVPGLVASDGGEITGVGDALSYSARRAFSVPGLGEVNINNHQNGYHTTGIQLADGREIQDGSTYGDQDFKRIDLSHAAIYTIGVEAAPVNGFDAPVSAGYQNANQNGLLFNPVYAEKGGDIAVNVGGSIRSYGPALENANWLIARGNAPMNTSYTGFQGVKPGTPFSTDGQSSLALMPDRFMYGMGALGGGDIDIQTGGDVDNLMVVLPTTVRVVGGRTEFEAKTLHTTGGGDLTMRVGGNLLGGTILVSKGTGAIDVAGSAIATGQADTSINPGLLGNNNRWWDQSNTQYLTLLVDDAQVNLQAGGDVELRRIASSTGGVTEGNWLGYTEATAVRVTSLGGDVTLLGSQNSPLVLPSKTALVATAGSISFGRQGASLTNVEVDAWPETRLDLLAMQNIDFFGAGGSYNYADLAISWFDPSWTPRVLNPNSYGSRMKIVSDDAFNGHFIQAGPGFGIDGANVHSGSDSYSRIYAAQGEIRGRGTQNANSDPGAIIAHGGTFYFGQETRLKAGTNIRMGQMTFIHHDGSDVSTMEANGSVYRPNARLYGPGRLWVQAGDEIWMGDTAGSGVRAIEARSSVADAVPLNGGSITMLAGIDQAPEYQSFFDYYLNPANVAEAPKWLRQYFVEGDREGLTVSTPVVLKDGRTETTVYAIELVNYMRLLRGEEPIPTEAVDEVSGTRPITRGALAAEIDPAEYAQALAAFKALDPVRQRPLAIRILNAELKTAGREAVGRSPETDGRVERFGDPTRGYAAIGYLFPGAQRKPGEALAAGEHSWTGDISMRVSQIRAENGGDVDLVAPGGMIQLASLAVANTDPAKAGVVTQRGGSMNAITYGDYIVNQSRTMTADDGDIMIWSSYGNIDAGRGRKSSLSVPPVIFPIDTWGQTRVQLSGLPNGAGIATLDQVDGKQGGDVDLYAFNGIVDAGDAGIRASRDLFVGAIEVRGLDNITVGGETNVDLSTEEGTVGPLNLENFARAAEDEALEKAFDMAAEVEKLRTVRQTILTGSVVSFGVEECIETETNRCPPSR